MTNHHFDENSSFWWKFVDLMKIHHFDANSSLWWKFINLRKNCQYDETLPLWLKCKLLELIILMKINNFDEKSSHWWIFIHLMKIDRSDENSLVWWKGITFMKMINFHKQSYHFDYNSSLNENRLFDEKFLTATKVAYFSENLLLIWKFPKFDKKWLLWLKISQNF